MLSRDPPSGSPTTSRQNRHRRVCMRRHTHTHTEIHTFSSTFLSFCQLLVPPHPPYNHHHCYPSCHHHPHNHPPPAKKGTSLTGCLSHPAVVGAIVDAACCTSCKAACRDWHSKVKMPPIPGSWGLPALPWRHRPCCSQTHTPAAGLSTLRIPAPSPAATVVPLSTPPPAVPLERPTPGRCPCKACPAQCQASCHLRPRSPPSLPPRVSATGTSAITAHSGPFLGPLTLTLTLMLSLLPAMTEQRCATAPPCGPGKNNAGRTHPLLPHPRHLAALGPASQRPGGSSPQVVRDIVSSNFSLNPLKCSSGCPETAKHWKTSLSAGPVSPPSSAPCLPAQ